MSVKKRVQKQMEFYLSASNLRSDKFLQQSMDDEGYMPIDVFLTFNRMKAIGATTRILTDAIRRSPLMVLSDDEAYVRPTELPDYDDDDSIERTIYIENFSAGSDHDSLRKLFSPFGKVNLVSMPRFPGSRKFKGFAFIEFASVEAVAPVLEVLKAHKKTAPSPDAPPTAGISGMAKARWVALRDSLKAQMAMAHTDTSSCSALQHAVESASTAPAPDFFTRGLLVQLTNVPVDTPRKALKAALEVAAPVAFLDDTKLRAGGSVVVARFLSTSHSANVLRHFAAHPLQLQEAIVEMTTMAGVAEEQYWTSHVHLQSAKQAQKRAKADNDDEDAPHHTKRKKGEFY